MFVEENISFYVLKKIHIYTILNSSFVNVFWCLCEIDYKVPYFGLLFKVLEF